MVLILPPSEINVVCEPVIAQVLLMHLQLPSYPRMISKEKEVADDRKHPTDKSRKSPASHHKQHPATASSFTFTPPNMPLTSDNPQQTNESRVPFGIPRSTVGLPNQWAHDALQLIASLPTVSVSIRVDSCYIIRDLERAPIYVASAPFEDVCCGAEEDEVSFSVTTVMHEPLIRVQTFGDRFCRGVPYIEGYVKLYPDTELGMIEGDINTVFLLNTSSGDNFCSIELVESESGICSCSQRSYEVIPLSAPHDIGSITTDGELFLILNFPRVFDVLRRTLLLSCVINMQYQIEADRRRSSKRTGI